ncbi:MAG: site-2 protease family protein [Candidatus Saccharimonas sp.]
MDIGHILIVLGVILVSMMLHELMHGFIALKLGDDTARLLGRLSFNPIKHVDPFLTVLLPMMIVVTNALTGANTPIFGGAKPVPINMANIRSDWGMALIALAGPLVNLVLAFICYGIFVLGQVDVNSLFGQILSTSVVVNLGFFAFNMLPLPPLDGSRVVYALAPDFVRKGMDFIERYGVLFVFMLVLLFNDVLFVVLSGIITGIINIFAMILGVS